MKKKLGNWLLRQADTNRQHPLVLAFILSLIGKLGFINEENVRGSFIYFTCLLDSEIAIRLHTKSSNIYIWWGDDEWAFEWGNVGLFESICLSLFEGQLINIIHSTTTHE